MLLQQGIVWRCLTPRMSRAGHQITGLGTDCHRVGSMRLLNANYLPFSLWGGLVREMIRLSLVSASLILPICSI